MISINLNTWDSHANGHRIEELEIGKFIDNDDMNVETILSSTQEILKNPSYISNAKKISSDFKGLPSLDKAITDLEELVSRFSK